MDPHASVFSNAFSAFSAVSPTISGYVSKATGDSISDMKVNLAFTLLNTIFLIIKEYEKAKAISAAKEVVDAFQAGYRLIDTDCVDAIAEAFYQRFRDQIHKMSISISTSKKLRLHENDGVVQFAYVIARRIGIHILQDRNKIIGESNIAICRGINAVGKFFKDGWKKVFGQVQNIIPSQPMPILQRCMLAIWNESEGLDKKIELDIMQDGKNKIWMAGDILTQTGYRLITDNNQYFRRKDYFHEEIGFCYVTMEEIHARGAFEAIEQPLPKNENEFKFITNDTDWSHSERNNLSFKKPNSTATMPTIATGTLNSPVYVSPISQNQSNTPNNSYPIITMTTNATSTTTTTTATTTSTTTTFKPY